MDQHRLVLANIAGFLLQQGCQKRAVVQHDLSGLFRHQSPQAKPMQMKR